MVDSEVNEIVEDLVASVEATHHAVVSVVTHPREVRTSSWIDLTTLPLDAMYNVWLGPCNVHLRHALSWSCTCKLLYSASTDLLQPLLGRYRAASLLSRVLSWQGITPGSVSRNVGVRGNKRRLKKLLKAFFPADAQPFELANVCPPDDDVWWLPYAGSVRSPYPTLTKPVRYLGRKTHFVRWHASILSCVARGNLLAAHAILDIWRDGYYSLEYYLTGSYNGGLSNRIDFLR